MAALAPEAVRAAEVDVGGCEGRHHVVVAGHHDVPRAVAVEVRHGAAEGALAGERGETRARRGVVDVAGGRFMVLLAVGEREVEEAVAVHVEAVDALQDAGAGDIEVLAGVAERAAPERLEAFDGPRGLGRLRGAVQRQGAKRR